MEVQLTQQRHHGLTLIGGHPLLGQPGAALVAEQVRGRAARDQVAMQHRLHLVLQPRALPDDMRPPCHLAPACLRLLVGHPHRRQVIGRKQLGEDL
jgi:hypothetical protein